MILNNDLNNYLENLIDLRKEKTDKLFLSQKEEKRPIVYRAVSLFFKQMVETKKPSRILEIGMNAGYSAICLAERLEPEGKLTSLEFREDHIAIAKQNFENFNLADKIEVKQGRAEEILLSMGNESFDMIFIDADKKGYPFYLDYAANHLSKDGIILVDNLLWKGAVYSEDQKTQQKPSTRTISEFNEAFMQLEGFISQILPIGDGLGFAVKMK